jgi:hypothetical protein
MIHDDTTNRFGPVNTKIYALQFSWQIHIFRFRFSAPICEQPQRPRIFQILPWIILYYSHAWIHRKRASGHDSTFVIRPSIQPSKVFGSQIWWRSTATWAKNSKFVGNPTLPSRILGCCFKKSTPFTVKFSGVLLAYGEVHDVDAYRGQRVIEAISQFMISP